MSVIDFGEVKKEHDQQSQTEAPQAAPAPEPQGDQTPPKQVPFKINFEENVTFYEIEIADKGTEEYTAEQLEEIRQYNSQYMQTGMTAAIFNTIDVCPCRNDEFMRRHIARAQILGIPPQQFAPKLEQVDIDAFTFAVIIVAKHGKYEGISGIVRQCKQCKKIEIWGDAMIIGDMLAASTDRFLSRRILIDNNGPIGEPVPQSAPPQTMEMGVTEMSAINDALEGQPSDLKFENIPLPAEE